MRKGKAERDLRRLRELSLFRQRKLPNKKKAKIEKIKAREFKSDSGPFLCLVRRVGIEPTQRKGHTFTACLSLQG